MGHSNSIKNKNKTYYEPHSNDWLIMPSVIVLILTSLTLFCIYIFNCILKF